MEDSRMVAPKKSKPSFSISPLNFTIEKIKRSTDDYPDGSYYTRVTLTWQEENGNKSTIVVSIYDQYNDFEELYALVIAKVKEDLRKKFLEEGRGFVGRSFTITEV
jgi:hypothetical protein